MTQQVEPTLKSGTSLQTSRQVFVSYAHEDEVAAAAIGSALEKEGLHCWIDKGEIRGGDKWSEKIADAIEKSSVLVLILSPKSNSSDYVEREVALATDQRLRIVTVIVEPVTVRKGLKFYLRTSHWLDATAGSLDQYLAKITEAAKVDSDDTPSGIIDGGKSGRMHDRHFSAQTKILFVGALVIVGFILILILRSLFFDRLSAINSFVVLPIGDESGVGELQYLGDGMAEEISKRFSFIPAIKVVPSSAMFGYIDSTWTHARIGRTLKVDAILDGHLSRQGENLTLSIAVIEAATSRQRWGKLFHRKVSEMPALVEQICDEISRTLQFPTTLDSGNRHGSVWPGSAAAYDAYLKGRFFKKRDKPADNALAMEYFKEALEADSSCIPVLVGLADAQEYHFENKWTTDPEVLIQAELNCNRALALDPNQAGAFAVLGAIEELRGDDQKALQLYTRGISADPSNTLVLTRMAVLSFNEFNDAVRAVKYTKIVQELEPYNVNNLMNLGVFYAMSRQYRNALDSFKKAVDLRPDLSDAWHNLGYYYERVGRPDSAVKAYAKALEIDNTRGDTYLCYATLALGNGEWSVAESVLVRGKDLLGDVRLTYAAGYSFGRAGKPAMAEMTYLEGRAMVEHSIGRGQKSASNYAILALFHARLGSGTAARNAARISAKLMEPDDDLVLLDLARVYAVLRDREKMLRYFRQARDHQPLEYDQYYVKTAIDFDNYRTDPQLLAISQQ